MRLHVNRFAATLAAVLWSGLALGQSVDLWPGVAPGSENWTYVEKRIDNAPGGAIVVNVVKPTLTAYLPKRSKATGAGVIIAPGGAFVALAIEHEGREVARWLQERGIAAFVLKYRLLEQRQGGMPSMPEMEEAGKFATADGIRALEVVRQRATEWGIAPERTGVIGFSAGGTVATGALFNEHAAARPGFAAVIYGGPFGGPRGVPSGLPPVFLAWAQNDPIAAATTVKLNEALSAAGQKPEAHAYASGGHGFGMKKQGTSSDHWIEAFYQWLTAQGFTKPAAKRAGVR